MDSKELGEEGERIAVLHLKKLGHEIIELNYRFGHLEVDIISKIDNVYHFHEVKTRATDEFGEPWQSVKKSKQAQIIKVADHFMKNRNLNNDCYFNIFSIIINKKLMELEYIEDAFYPMG